MVNPKRLIDEQTTEFERELLHAGRRDVMPDRSGRVILAGLGLASQLAAGVAAATNKLTLMKTVLVAVSVGAAGSLAVYGGQQWLAERAPAKSPTASHVAARAPAASPPAVEEAASAPATKLELEELEALQEPAPSGNTVRPAQKAPVDTLPLELAAIDEARSALAGGNAALASRLLDRYAARFPKPRLGAEAAVLRIETLVARGDRAQATRLGKAFLARAPNSPYARRVRSLIGDTAAAP